MPDQDLVLDNEPLSDDAKIWRYIKLSTLVYLLKGKRSFLPKLEALRQGDQFEGEMDFERLQERYLDLRSAENWLRRDEGETKSWERPDHLPSLGQLRLRELMKRRCVWCWHQSEHECMAQWRIYGREGVAIRSDVGSVKKVLMMARNSDGIDFVYGRVCYLQPGQHPPFSRESTIAGHPYFIKHAAFGHEREVRFVLADHDVGYPGRSIQTDPLTLLKEIVISPFYLPSEATALLSAIRDMLPSDNLISVRTSGTQDPEYPWGRKGSTFRERYDEPAADQWISENNPESDLPDSMRLFSAGGGAGL